MKEKSKLLCVLCVDIFNNESMKPLAFKWHLTTQQLGKTTAEHISQVRKLFYQENKLNCRKCVHVCTDGARAIADHSGVVAPFYKFVPEMQWIHCSFHRKVWLVKRVPEELKSLKTMTFTKNQTNVLSPFPCVFQLDEHQVFPSLASHRG